jgi:hypothetical protein
MKGDNRIIWMTPRKLSKVCMNGCPTALFAPRRQGEGRPITTGKCQNPSRASRGLSVTVHIAHRPVFVSETGSVSVLR